MIPSGTGNFVCGPNEEANLLTVNEWKGRYPKSRTVQTATSSRR